MATIGLDNILANQGPTEASTKAKASNVMGKDQFFNLLVTQLKYQDPLNPVENTEFTAQLAQFSSLEKLTSMSDSIDRLSSLQTSINNIQSLSFIGKRVSASGNIMNYTGQDIGINFNLDKRASEVKVKIYSKDGAPVRTITMKEVVAGEIEVPWDGTNNSGEKVSPGRYSFSIEAVDYEGNPITTTSRAMGTVTGVRYDNGTTYLMIDNTKEVTISDIDKIFG